MISFFTLAGNQMNTEPSGVDPRTGQFSTVIQLGHINGNRLRGPSMAFGLGDQPFATQDYGFGTEWGLPWTTYDPHTGKKGTLFTSEGSNFKVTKDDNPSITQQKPRVIDFSMYSSGAYKIVHAHGGIEILGSQYNSIAVPSQIFTPLGHSLSLNWDQQLQWIKDEELNLLLQASYNLGSSFTLTLNPNGSSDEKVIINGVIDGGQLQSLTVDDWTWSFSYTDVGQFDNNVPPTVPQLLKKIVHPTGLVEEVVYTGDIMAFPSIAQQSTRLPAVTTYTKTPNGGQPAQVSKYEYQQHGANPTGNFLGYGASMLAWDPDRDNLYYATQSYSYTTLCNEMSGPTVVSSVERTFDQFHCIRNETRTKGQCTCKKDYEYAGQSPGGYDSQGNTFLMPTKITTTYTGPTGTRSEHVTSTYDPTYGDKMQHVSADGITTDYQYYPLLQDDEECPKSPTGFDRLVKSITTTYLDRSYSGGNDYPGYQRVKSITHCKVNVGGDPLIQSNPVAYAACPLQETTQVDGTTIHTLGYEYNQTVGNKDHGRVKNTTETVYDGVGEHVSTTAFTYTHDDLNRQLSVAKIFTAEDDSTSTTTSVASMVTGLEAKSYDELGIETDYTYDTRGRELTRTVAAGTEYERTVSFQYDFEKLNTTDTVTVPTKTTTHTKGAKEKVWYDGSLRPVKHQKYITTTSGQTASQRISYNAWMTLSTSTYDDQGHLTQTQEFDYRAQTGLGAGLLTPITTYGYNDWGQTNLTTYGSGRFAGNDHDPVLRMTTLTWTGGQPNAARAIQYNDQNQPETVTLYDKDGHEYSSTNSQYDGARRLRKYEDELGNITTVDYDLWQRPSKITMADGTVVTRTYETFSGVELIKEIRVYDPSTDTTTSLGTQTHDGLHRVTQRVVGGRLTSHHYANSGSVPDCTIEPDGTQINYTYIPELGSVLASTTAGTQTTTLGYDAQGGWLTSAESNDASSPGLSLTYDEWGNFESRTLTFEDRTRTENYGNSAFGRMLSVLDPGGDSTTFYYNAGTGLPSQNVGWSESITYSYSKGIFTGWKTFGSNTTVTLTLDEFLRETDRSVTRGSSAFDLSQKFYANGMLKEQTTTLGATTLRVDNFEYDERNRLSVFTSSGAALAVDPYGKSITGQNFDYDAIDNLTSVTTTFTGGTDNATYSYENTDPCQLSGITHDGPGYPTSITFAYDDNGRMTTDDAGRTLSYNPFGRLSSVDANNATTHYFYDGLGVRREQELPDGSSLEYYYRGHYPSTVINHSAGGDSYTRWMRQGSNCMVERGPDGSLKDIVTDPKGSVVATAYKSGLDGKGYGAYGFTPPDDGDQSALGYNGECTDPVTGNYHLGNGYRAFSPALMRFTAPDSLSPFGGGGLNTYGYCGGNPTNAIDPTGHMKWWQWGLLIGGIAAGAAFGVGEGWATIVAWQAASKFADIAADAAEEGEFAVAAAARTRMVVNYGKVGFRGIMTAKNLGQVAMGIATPIVQSKAKYLYVVNGRTFENGAYRAMKGLTTANYVFMGLSLLEGVEAIRGRWFSSDLEISPERFQSRQTLGRAVRPRAAFLEPLAAMRDRQFEEAPPPPTPNRENAANSISLSHSTEPETSRPENATVETQTANTNLRAAMRRPARSPEGTSATDVVPGQARIRPTGLRPFGSRGTERWTFDIPVEDYSDYGDRF